MRNIMKFSLAIMLILLWSSLVFSQPGRGLNQGAMTRVYNTATETKVEGKITKVEVADSGYGRFPGTLVDLKTKDKEVKAYIAPTWYLNKEKIELKTDQSFTVTGSQVTYNNQTLLIARIIKHNGREITIRDSKGVPVWAGKAMGPGAGRGKGRRRR